MVKEIKKKDNFIADNKTINNTLNLVNPFALASKITPQIIEKTIDYTHKDLLRKQIFYTTIVSISLIFLCFFFYIFKDNTDFIFKIIIPVLTFLAGLLGGRSLK